MVKILYLRDRNRGVVDAWRASFADLVEAGRVEVSQGDIFEGPSASAIVSPANSFGFMDGGIDMAYLGRFGVGLQDQLRQHVQERFHGELPVGQATIVGTGDVPFAWMVSAPTMRIPMSVAGTVNAYLAMRAALVAVLDHNETRRDRIDSLLCPGMATAIGKMPPHIAANQMRQAWAVVIEKKRWIRPSECLGSQALLVGT